MEVLVHSLAALYCDAELVGLSDRGTIYVLDSFKFVRKGLLPGWG